MLLSGMLMLTASESMAQTSPDRQSKQRQDGGDRRHFDGPQEERDARRALFRIQRAKWLRSEAVRLSLMSG